MPDISNPNLCGADVDVNKLMNQFDKIKDEITAGMDKAASELSAALDVGLTELEGDLRNLVPELPSLPATNLQAEIKSLQSLIPGSPEFLALTIKLKTEFGEALTQAGQDLDKIITAAVPAIGDALGAAESALGEVVAAAGDAVGALGDALGDLSVGSPDICKLAPNLELAAGAKAPIEKAPAVLQAKAAAIAEEVSKIIENPNVKAAVEKIEVKIKKFGDGKSLPLPLGPLTASLGSLSSKFGAAVSNPATQAKLKTATARFAGILNAGVPELNEAAVNVKSSLAGFNFTVPKSVTLPTVTAMVDLAKSPAVSALGDSLNTTFSSFGNTLGGALNATGETPSFAIPNFGTAGSVSVATPTSSAIVTSTGEVKKANLVDKGGFTYRVNNTSELLYFKDAKPHPTKKVGVEYGYSPDVANNKPLLCWKLKIEPYTITSVRGYHTIEEFDDDRAIYIHEDAIFSAFKPNAKPYSFREMFSIDDFGTDTKEYIAVTNLATGDPGLLDFEWTGHDPTKPDGEDFNQKYVGVSLRVVYTFLEEYDPALAMADEEAASGSNPDKV